MIIDGRQRRKKKNIEKTITAAGWSYVLFSLTQIIFSVLAWYFNMDFLLNNLIVVESIYDTVKIVLITIFVASIVLSILLFWSRYNRTRFGNLNRRKFPKDVTDSELMSYFKLDTQLFNDMKNNRVTVLEKNILK
ncbi:MAG: pgaD [Bacillales bacterium]|jgi:poly-beta-1,6-N-acetyl-D-glucosamine biosynthesis protein PgaD|nr:pgaD [Bacillales bacterium]